MRAMAQERSPNRRLPKMASADVRRGTGRETQPCEPIFYINLRFPKIRNAGKIFPSSSKIFSSIAHYQGFYGNLSLSSLWTEPKVIPSRSLRLLLPSCSEMAEGMNSLLGKIV
jgi:hypothetical protein